MTLDQFIQAINEAPTWEEARAVVSEFEADFRSLVPMEKNRARRAWKDRQAAIEATPVEEPEEEPAP